MSVLSDFQYTLSSETLKSKLTLEERAQILVDLTEDMGWSSYWDVPNASQDLNLAIADLKFIDDKSK